MSASVLPVRVASRPANLKERDHVTARGGPSAGHFGDAVSVCARHQRCDLREPRAKGSTRRRWTAIAPGESHGGLLWALRGRRRLRGGRVGGSPARGAHAWTGSSRGGALTATDSVCSSIQDGGSTRGRSALIRGQLSLCARSLLLGLGPTDPAAGIRFHDDASNNED
ncbi:hypothetical protein GN956_G14656 [Arapaima gigas]